MIPEPIPVKAKRNSDSRALLTDAVATLLTAGARDGSLRTDVTPDNVLLLMGGIAYSVRHGTKEQTRPLVDLFMDALTTRGFKDRL
ncbi:hypothetical protein AB0N81_12135 [Streptomyces sp. NPDC093510]|uniref:SbtR family transcriptional regulator n=1 Tax=Streptomyces sp. NPDC093510 TaxID=3155199 RepID=UPI00342E1952